MIGLVVVVGIAVALCVAGWVPTVRDAVRAASTGTACTGAVPTPGPAAGTAAVTADAPATAPSAVVVPAAGVPDLALVTA